MLCGHFNVPELSTEHTTLAAALLVSSNTSLDTAVPELVNPRATSVDASAAAKRT